MFSLLGLHHAYVTDRGRLLGVVSLKEVRWCSRLGNVALLKMNSVWIRQGIHGIVSHKRFKESLIPAYCEQIWFEITEENCLNMDLEVDLDKWYRRFFIVQTVSVDERECEMTRRRNRFSSTIDRVFKMYKSCCSSSATHSLTSTCVARNFRRGEEWEERRRQIGT